MLRVGFIRVFAPAAFVVLMGMGTGQAQEPAAQNSSLRGTVLLDAARNPERIEARLLSLRPEGVAAFEDNAPPPLPSMHRFWDKTNIALFLGVAAVRTLDFTSTEHFRERGVDEGLLTNSIVDNKPLFAGIEAAGTAASIAVAYLLHRKGHRQLERWVSVIHIGVGTFGDIRNYTLSRQPGVP